MTPQTEGLQVVMWHLVCLAPFKLSRRAWRSGSRPYERCQSTRCWPECALSAEPASSAVTSSIGCWPKGRPKRSLCSTISRRGGNGTWPITPMTAGCRLCGGKPRISRPWLTRMKGCHDSHPSGVQSRHRPSHDRAGHRFRCRDLPHPPGCRGDAAVGRTAHPLRIGERSVRRPGRSKQWTRTTVRCSRSRPTGRASWPAKH